MNLMLIVEVPTSANQDEVFHLLDDAAKAERGITLRTATGYKVDVDLRYVEQLSTTTVMQPQEGDAL
jgi:hypothetical protein